MSTTYRVLCQVWEDFFPGFGRRTLGFSLHSDVATLERFKSAHINSQQQHGFSPQPAGEPYWVDLPVHEDLAADWPMGDGVYCALDRYVRLPPRIEVADEVATTQVICQQWQEHERGWGTRPDGYSLHLTMADRNAYIEAYWAAMPDQVPDEYSHPVGDWYYTEVDDVTLARIRTEQYGLRVYHGPTPKPPANLTKVWRSMKS